MDALKIVGAVFVFLLALAVILRVRKLRRDEMRELAKPIDRRLVTPPPSPYAPSRGFRLLDQSGEPIARPPVERPRLDPSRSYVFGESLDREEVVPSALRHSQEWFLSRSSHRSALSIWLRRLVVLVLLALIILVVATYYVDHHKKGDSGAGSKTTTTLLATTTTSLPAAYRASSVHGEDADYLVPAGAYDVSVDAALGTTWVTFETGPSHTLAWQGDVTAGDTRSFSVTGESSVTLGSPSSAQVKVAGRPVVLPSPLPSPATLVFSPVAPTG